MTAGEWADFLFDLACDGAAGDPNDRLIALELSRAIRSQIEVQDLLQVPRESVN